MIFKKNLTWWSRNLLSCILETPGVVLWGVYICKLNYIEGGVSVAKNKKEKPRRQAPATNETARERQLVRLAVDLAEKQIIDGTASSQVITHFLKIGSTKEKIQNDILEEEKKLIKARTESLASAKRVEELYKKALDAMRAYGGHESDDNDD